MATSLFTDFPFSGEVNILTTGALAPGAVFSPTALPRGVAYLALSAPGPGGEWLIRGAMSEADLSSWIVAGAFASKAGGAHRYNLGLSYSTQDYQGGNPAALAAVTDGSRNAGELYAFDQWSLNSAITLDYGARYAHYDYLQARGLLSPRFGVAIEALPKTTIRATVAQRMVAPGAEEFLATNTPGPWLPPERTFAPLARSRGDRRVPCGAVASFEASVERQFTERLPSPWAGSISRWTISWSRSSDCVSPVVRNRSAITTWRTPARSKPTAGWCGGALRRTVAFRARSSTAAPRLTG